MAGLYVGTSGFSYEHWKGVFYPEGLPASKRLEFFSRQFTTVEINNTFYRMPTRELLIKWARTVPDGFVFTLKAWRGITHLKRLRAPGRTREFLETASVMGDKLGMILFQLPPSFGADLDVLEAFLEALPKGGLYAFEFRDESWYTERTRRALCDHGVAFCIHDFAAKDCPEWVTARASYLRFHGVGGRYEGCYPDEHLARKADLAGRLIEKRIDVWAYFNNDIGGHAVANARTFGRLVQQRA